MRRPSLSHVEGGSSTSLSSASGFGHHVGAGGHDGRDKVHRLDHRHKYSGKAQNSGLPMDNDRLDRNDLIQMKASSSLSGNDDKRNSPVLQNIGNKRNIGVGAEESSDDEMGSQMSARSLPTRS